MNKKDYDNAFRELSIIRREWMRDDTKWINDHIEDCGARGATCVNIPNGVYHMTGPVILRSHSVREVNIMGWLHLWSSGYK